MRMDRLVLQLVLGSYHPRPPSQHVSQIVWQREHWSLARISMSSPPQTGHAGRQACSSFVSSFGIGSLRFHVLQFIHVMLNCRMLAIETQMKYGNCATATHL